MIDNPEVHYDYEKDDKLYPLFPLLPDVAKEEAQQLIEDFKTEMKRAADEVISKLYTDIVFYIESDTWSNFRNKIVDGMRNYNNRHLQGKYDFKQIRESLLREYRDALIEDMNQDLVEENEKLKKELEFERQINDKRRSSSW